MANPTLKPLTVQHSTGRSPTPERSDLWLAFLRIVVGLWFLKSLFTKIGVIWWAGALPLPSATGRWIGFMPSRIREWAEINPIGWYREFLLETVLPYAPLFAQLTAFGETAVGLGLTFGFLTGLSSLGGIFLLLNYALASAGQNFNQQGLHIILLACMLAFLGARAGRIWGVDGWLLRRHPRHARRIPLV